MQCYSYFCVWCGILEGIAFGVADFWLDHCALPYFSATSWFLFLSTFVNVTSSAHLHCCLLLYFFAGETERECIHEPVPFRSLLRVRETQGTRVPKHRLDFRVYCTTKPHQD